MSNIPSGGYREHLVREHMNHDRVPRCKVTHCWHRAVEDGLCLGCLAELYEHVSHGCPDGVCELCQDTQEPVA